MTYKDVIEQLFFDYNIEFTQSGCLSKNIIAFAFGNNTTSFPNKIEFFDLINCKNIGILNLGNLYNSEIESLCFYNNELYVNYLNGSIFNISISGG